MGIDYIMKEGYVDSVWIATLLFSVEFWCCKDYGSLLRV
jgi:hypothetical protein